MMLILGISVWLHIAMVASIIYDHFFDDREFWFYMTGGKEHDSSSATEAFGSLMVFPIIMFISYKNMENNL